MASVTSRPYIRREGENSDVFFYVVTIAASSALGCAVPRFSVLALGFAYNQVGGSDRDFWTRNLLNAAGFTRFATGATMVASGDSQPNERAYQWFGIIFGIVFTTVQMQDLPDQDGEI